MGFQEENDGMSQSVSLFRKYLFGKPQNNIGKTNMEESQVIIRQKYSGRPTVAAKFCSHMSRQVSFLEQELLPAVRSNEIQSQNVGNSSLAAQLTIFYAGEINVYDNIPADKAQAIMLLASESSVSSNHIAKELPKIESETRVQWPNMRPSACKSHTDIPIARKLSLQHFLEKRRQRIACKSPYSIPRSKRQESELRGKFQDSNANHAVVSLSPFPTRLGYDLPVSTNNGY